MNLMQVLSVDNLWILATDRAVGKFINAVKQNTFDDIAHMGLFALVAALGVCIIVWVLGLALRSWGVRRDLHRSKMYESPSLQQKGRIALDIRGED